MRKWVVVKVGTSSIFPNGKLDEGLLRSYVRGIIHLRNRGIGVTLVSSGAVRSGRTYGIPGWGTDEPPSDDVFYAGIGQRYLFNVWAKEFDRYCIEVAPVLVTYADWTDTEHKRNLRVFLLRCTPDTGTIAIVNENDILSPYEELWGEWGENDILAAKTSWLVSARYAIFITNGHSEDGKGGGSAKNLAVESCKEHDTIPIVIPAHDAEITMKSLRVEWKTD